jgi:hypothetical protein
VDFSALFDALKSNPWPAFLTISLVALGWLFRDARRRDDENAKALEAAHAAHLQTAMQVAPLAASLVKCVEVVERLEHRLSTGGS